MADKATILFFDSGVGGFSVYREVLDLLPQHHYLYAFDNEMFPFSEKTEDLIIQRTVAVCKKINETYPLDLIVIACNTASTVVLPALREAFDIPIVGTVPAIKPAAQISETKHIGLLATKGTVKRPYVDKLIEQYASSCQVEKLGSTKLVEIAQDKIQGDSVDLIALRDELAVWKNIEDLDTVILGCTHFPLIRDEIQICLPQVQHFIDPGLAIAKRVAFLLGNVKLRSKNEAENLIFCTKQFEIQNKFMQALKHRWGFERLIVLNLDE
ncbi:glutamate racemase [Actinobacillus porcinus]|uniref:glutamate racemase n=1 Tax=Actinobacillus porcinus TaxID=51048 RepID=UPI002352E48A|nr:glutamate racemase [Actinobacillus porcinus]